MEGASANHTRTRARARALSLSLTLHNSLSLSLSHSVLISPLCSFSLVLTRSHVRSFVRSLLLAAARTAVSHPPRNAHYSTPLGCRQIRLECRIFTRTHKTAKGTGRSQIRLCSAATFRRRYVVRAIRRTYMFGYPTCNGASQPSDDRM